MSARVWSLLVALSVLWGGTFVLQEVALRELPPFTIVLARVELAALALLLLIRLSGHPLPRDPRLLGSFLVMGLLNNAVPFSLIVWGQTQIASGLAAILNATTPLVAVLLADRLTADERMTIRRLTGVLLGIGGVVTIVGPSVLSDLGSALAGQLAVLGAAFSYALAGIFARRFRGQAPMVVAAGQTGAGTVLLLPVVLLVDRPFELPLPGPTTVGALVALALFSTALAYILYFRILALAGATNLLLVTLLIPVTALLLGALLLGEEISLAEGLGLLLIALSLLVIDGRLAGIRRAARPWPTGGAGHGGRAGTAG